ncbi:toprim domain-containing protein [Prevotella sp. A2931]|uniref:Toprim domain-containing protein n=1 Tax=Prevotella illustrans TaxID=2800387 RepID=A0ABS3M4Y9_9BACT|nr:MULTISPECIES: toprim domain-containing protein [Prevotella]MBO1363238.1 toprim domain-containing protein [Prevotella illustrans]PTL26614.1 DNA primase [Prevotella sp. oral taxon 820]
MNIDQIKQIKLQDFLAAMGCKPVKQYGVNLMYLSPLRTEKHASFKVNTEINQWYDFGIGRGGNIIALAELLYNSSDVSYLIHQIERNAPSSVSGSLPTVKPTTPQNSFEHLQVLPITHPALIKYLEERCIDIETARTVCKELHFDTRGKHYFGIGFPNIAGGYEIRNPFFKGCIAPKDISHFYAEEPKKICFVFEGFIDFLSFMTLRRKENDGLKRQDYLVLNSVSNIQKALERLSQYDSVQCFLDNDNAGRNAYLQLSKELENSVVDASTLYNGYKDLNEYLCAKIKHSEKAENKKTKGIKL